MLTIRLTEWPPSPEIRQSITDRGYRIVDELEATQQLLVDRLFQPLAGETPAQIKAHAATVKLIPGVLEADPDFPVKVFVNDARRLTRAILIGDVGDCTAPYLGAGVRVGIIDTGVDAQHPGLVGRIESQRDYTGEGDGDAHGHGTHVAGIIGMRPTNGYVGLAPAVTFRIYKVLGVNGGGSATAIVRAINQAVLDHCEVINMSLGGSQPGDRDQLTDAVDAAVRAGVTVVVAAGNEGMEDPFNNTPAKSALAITVGATEKNPEVIAGFSSGGITEGGLIKPDLSAPGCAIVSARAAGTSMGTPHGDLLTAASGTSMATPVITGIVAMLIGAHDAACTTLTPRDIKGRLMVFAQPVGEPSEHEQGTGRVDAYRAYMAEETPAGSGDSRTRQPPEPSPAPDPSPCANLLAAALQDPILADLVRQARHHVESIYKAGGSIAGLDLLVQAAEQVTATVRSLQRPEKTPTVP